MTRLQDDNPRARILIVDEDPQIRNALVQRASQMGFLVMAAEDGTRAMEALHGESIDVLIIELVLPGKPALDVIRDAQRLQPNLQAIAFTRNPSVEMTIEALRAGANDFLLKPLKSLTEFEVALYKSLENCARLRENMRRLEEMQGLAITDPLTGLYNRRKLMEDLEREIERARRYDRALSLVMIDLDNLKHINDTRGHHEGDRVLKHVADTIASGARKSDLVTRYGGDEFLILLPEADLKAATRVAKRICARIARISTKEFELSASAGAVQWDDVYPTAGEFIQEVDRVLYDAKSSAGVGLSEVDVSVEDELLEGIKDNPSS
ncbi:MAG: diguanylate cyclase [Anaerolineales bacterium]|jgi:diguanylate cyclase (GGDEF)-like protein